MVLALDNKYPNVLSHQSVCGGHGKELSLWQSSSPPIYRGGEGMEKADALFTSWEVLGTEARTGQSELN